MKLSKIDAVVAEMQAEKFVVDACLRIVEAAPLDESVNALEKHRNTLAACIARLTGNGSEPAPKPTRTRKPRKATEPSI